MRMFYLIGKQLDHSFSPDYFENKFSVLGLNDCRYEAMPFSDLSTFRSWAVGDEQIVGINITVPYKIEIIKHLDELDKTAACAGAVNTILKKENKLIGFNTDIIGFKQSLLQTSWHHKFALVLGSGGVSKAVCFVLAQLGIEFINVSRQRNNHSIEYKEITRKIMAKTTLIVNCTPLGMTPDVEGFPQIPYQWLTGKHLCFDVIYNPSETTFMKKSEAHGAEVKNGFEMLVLQAEEAWRIWTEK